MTTGDSDRDEKLKVEYTACQDGYNSRDRTIPTQAIQMMLLFAAVPSLASFLGTKLVNNPGWSNLATWLLFSVGGAWLAALHVDMASNMSCKGALRERMEQIERYWSGGVLSADYGRVRMWTDTIRYRERFIEEMLFKVWLKEWSGRAVSVGQDRSWMIKLSQMISAREYGLSGPALQSLWHQSSRDATGMAVSKPKVIWMAEDLYIWVGRLALPSWVVVFWVVVLFK